MTDTTPQHRPIRVLSVEDDVNYERLIEDWLSGEAGPGFRVTPAVRLEDVARNFHPEGYDVMLLDLSLPDSVGLDTVAIAREIVSDLPIVVITEGLENVIPGRVIQYGADRCLIKGAFQPEILVEALVEAAGGRRHESFGYGCGTPMADAEGSMDSMIAGRVGENLSLRAAQDAASRYCSGGEWFERQRRSTSWNF